MCRRFLKFTPICVITLAIGVAIAVGLDKFLLSETDLTGIENAVEEVRLPEPRVDPSESLLIEYDCSLMGVDTLTALFTVTNIGGGSISFDINERTGRFPAHVSNAADHVDLIVSAEVSKRELRPGESAGGFVDVPQDGSPFDLSFRYRFGNSLLTRWASVDVPSQEKSYTCNAQESPR